MTQHIENKSRRKHLLNLTKGSALIGAWSAPIVAMTSIPAHAQSSGVPGVCTPGSVTFDSSGQFTFTVPPFCTTVEVTLSGAGGGYGLQQPETLQYYPAGAGELQSDISLNVIAGNTYDVFVGEGGDTLDISTVDLRNAAANNDTTVLGGFGKSNGLPTGEIITNLQLGFVGSGGGSSYFGNGANPANNIEVSGGTGGGQPAGYGLPDGGESYYDGIRTGANKDGGAPGSSRNDTKGQTGSVVINWM